MHWKPFYIIFIFSILSFITVSPAWAQQEHKGVTGIVLDGTNHRPMGFASVSVLASADSTLIVGAYTNETGKFSLSFTSADTVLIRISYLGYQSRIEPVYFSPGHKNTDVGKLSLTNLSNTLNIVTVSAPKAKMYDFKKDTVEFNVPEDFMTGGTAQDVLEYTPTLTFDGNDNIMVKGKGNVGVYIDSKPVDLTGMDVKTYLQNTPSFMIEQIQILKTPPDPQDAAEALAAGITGRYYINIVTRKIRYRGYSAGLTGGINSRKELTGRLRYNMNLDPFKLNYFNNLHYSTDSSYLHRTSFTDKGDSSVLDQRSYQTRFNFDQYLNGTYEFKYSDKERLRLRTKAGWNERKSSSTNISTIDNPKSIPDEDRIQTSHNNSNGYNFSTNADYRKEYAQEGKRLTANMDFSQSRRNNNSVSLGRYLLNDDTLNQKNKGSSNQIRLRGNIQFKNTFGNEKFYSLNAGMNLSGRHNLNDISQSDSTHPVMTKRNSLSTNYFSSSSNYNILGTLGKRDEKLGWVTAIGMSYYLQNGSDHYQLSSIDNHVVTLHNAIGMNFSPADDQEVTVRFNPGFQSYTQVSKANDSVNALRFRYTNFIPGASVKYELGDHEVTLSYDRDIDRPSWNQMNPFIDNTDPLNIRKGNPDLRPSFTNEYHMRYEYNHEALYAAFDLEKDVGSDVISSYRTVDSAGVATRTYVNLNKRIQDDAEVEAGGTYFKDLPSINGNLNLNAEAGMELYRLRSDDPHVAEDFRHVSGFSSHFKMWTSVKFGLFSLIVNGRYEGPRYFAQGKRPSRFSSGLRAKADLMNRNLNLTLSVENLFGASVQDAYYKTDNYIQYSSNRQNVRYFSLYITYRLKKYSKQGQEGEENG